LVEYKIQLIVNTQHMAKQLADEYFTWRHFLCFPMRRKPWIVLIILF